MLTLLILRPHLRTSPVDHSVKYGEAMKELHYTREKKITKSFNVAAFLDLLTWIYCNFHPYSCTSDFLLVT